MVSAKDVTAVIAAGGMSIRFGQDKATLVRDGEVMVDRMAAVAGQVAHRVLLGLPPAQETHPAAWRELPMRFEVVRDDPAGIGPMGCLRASFQLVQTPWVLLIACDLPLLEPKHLRQLVETVQEGMLAVVAVGPSGHFEPLCALYHRRMFNAVEVAIQQENYALNHLLRGANPHLVKLEGAALTNTNFPDPSS